MLFFDTIEAIHLVIEVCKLALSKGLQFNCEERKMIEKLKAQAELDLVKMIDGCEDDCSHEEMFLDSLD